MVPVSRFEFTDESSFVNRSVNTLSSSEEC